jgi:hypothetical protein
VSVCPARSCPGCRLLCFSREELTKHRKTCSYCVYRRCRRLSAVPEDYCELHVQLKKTRASIAALLLDFRTRFPVTDNINRVMHAWTYEPLNTVVIDFEYTPGRSSHRRSLQLAIANANGEWIVPNTNINHGKTRTDLAFLLDRIIDTNVRFDSSQVLRKVYDSLDGGELTNWLTVQEISNLTGQYCKVRCLQFQSSLAHYY